MSISEAIALVRKGAKKASLDGALGVLAARLKSDIIPAPLRPLAARLVALLGVEDEPARYSDVARQQLEVVSLDRALTRAAANNVQVPPLPRSLHVAHGENDVCPFTGLRADGTVATPVESHAAAAHHLEAPAERAAARQLDVQPVESAARDVEVTASTPAQSQAPLAATSSAEARPAASEPPHEEFAEVHTGELLALEVAAAPAAEPTPHAAPHARAEAPAAGKPKRGGHKRGRGAKSAGEKRKEKLAVANDVTNTSARSATQPAAKQPSGRGQTSGRKKA